MLRTALLIGSLAAWTMALGGCHLYFGDDNDGNDGYSYCDDTGCYWCDDWGCYPDGDGGGGPGWSCSNNYECAAGCYCSADGFCEEAGFCSGDEECPSGFECDDRASCVPDGSDSACTTDDQCPSGSFCDETAGYCVGSWTCDSDAANADEQCGLGYECDDRDTCVPEPCTSDDQCQEGCYCDENIGECVETSTCSNDTMCTGDLTCDEERSTCVPESPITCQGEVTCADEAPICPSGSTPEIQDGCYTGECMAKDQCPDGAPFECSDLDSDEQACFDHADCAPVYKGINCQDPDGNQCSSGDNNCTCESFEYDYCEANGNQ